MFEGILQPTHLILILVIALVVFGPGKLPELGKSLGTTIKEFRGSMKEVSEAMSDVSKPSEGPATNTTAASAQGQRVEVKNPSAPSVDGAAKPSA